MTAPQTTSQFIDTLGVNVHVEYTDGKYANAANVVADLAYLGETHVRDAVLNPSNQGQANYDTLAKAGIKFDMFSQGNNLGSSLGLIDSFLARHPGAISMIEGPNEVNNFPISFNSLTGDAAAVSYQNALYAAVKADPHLLGVPVADLTSYPFLAGASDYANYHFYPFQGAQPSSAYGASFTGVSAEDGGKAMVMTEGGYNTLLNDTYFGGVDELAQAKLTLNLYCDNAKAGVAQSYVYQLLDAYADPTNSNSDSHFGLFHLDNSPKLAATAIHNLTSVLSSGGDAGVTPSALAYEVSGLPSLGSALTLTKNATTHDILLWNEPSIWDGTAKAEVAAAPTSTALHFDDAANVSVYDPLAGTTPTASFTGVHDVVVSLTDHPLVIEVSSATSGSPTSASVFGSAAPIVVGAVMGGDGADALVASTSPATIFGMGGDDTITGGLGADTLYGNMGADSISAGAGADVVFAGKDNDAVFGDAGADLLFGNLGADILHGGTGADTLFGGQGNDILFGDDGDDVLVGDLGDDTLTGGTGADAFVFAPGSGHDTVTDFVHGQDHLDISAYLAAHATYTLSDDSQGVHVAFSTGDSVELLGVHASSLSVSGGWIV